MTMANIGLGTAVLIILFGMGTVLWIGGFNPGFVTFAESLTGGPEALFNAVLQSFPSAIAVGGITLAISFFTSNSGLTSMLLAHACISAIGYTLLMPTTFFSTAPLPYEIMLSMQAFFTMLYAIAYVQFLVGREF